MNWIKNALQDFPTHPATVVAGIFVFVITGGVVTTRLAMGKIMPDGYDFWIGSVLAVIGITTAGGIGKRLTDVSYVQAKKTNPPNVTVEAPSKVEVGKKE